MKKPTLISKPYLVAECGCSHGGNLLVAREMIEVAAKICHVQCVKFQKRDIKSMPDEVYDRPYVNQNSFGATYGLHRECLEFTVEQHCQLAEHCERNGVEYSTSVWDIASAKSIVKYINPKKIKIPAAKNTDWAMLQWLRENYHGELHISMGMTTAEEKDKILYRTNGNEEVYYLCTSSYPARFQDLCLEDFKESYYTGFSGHHLGIAADIAVLGMGCEYFERHFTLDRTQKGTDHAASLEPDGMRKLRRDLDNVHKALSRSDGGIKECEKSARTKLKGGTCQQ